MKDVILHCSDSTWGDAAEIDIWHKQRGWDKIGYHKVILNGRRKAGELYNDKEDGFIEDGRRLNETGAHCYGHNDAIGICLIGKSGKFTSEQMISTFYILKQLQIDFKEITIHQHSDYDTKKSFCAGFTEYQMNKFREGVKA